MRILLHPAVAEATDTGSTAAPSAPAVDNLSGAQLVAALTQRRQAKASAPAPTATPPANTQTPTVPEPTQPETPEAEPAEPATNAAPTPDTEPTAATEPETEPTAELESEPETPEAEPESKAFASMQKRIDKLTAKLRDAERKLEEAGTKEPKPETQAPEAGSREPQSAGADAELQTVNAELTKWQRVQAWVKANPAGGDVMDDHGNVVQSVSAEQAEALAMDAHEKVAELAAQRAVRMRELKAHHAQLAAQAETELHQRFPWSSNPESEQMAYLRQLEQQIPGVKAFPGWKLFAAHAIENIQRTRAAETKPKAKPAATPPKVPVPGGASAPRGNPLEKQLAEAEAAFEKSGNHLDGQRVMKLRREFRLMKR